MAGPSEDMVGAMPGDGYAQWSGTSATAPLVAERRPWSWKQYRS
ncbi:hypothetical protein QJS66_08520 [Kocuria rhizophila]|nr:hypothetical protein QJS66_08520 [Kocuria rhizophila]